MATPVAPVVPICWPALTICPALTLRLQQATARFEKAEAKLGAYSPYGVLGRGYSLTTTADGAVVRDAAALHAGGSLRTRFAKGETNVVVC